MDRLFEVAVVRDHHGEGVAGPESVGEQMAGKADIRSLLLGSPQTWARGRELC
jgi:hypothetical protein